MPRLDIYKTLSQTGDVLKHLAIFNPLSIRKKGVRTKAMFALSLVCFFWGTTWIASKVGVKHMPSLQMAGLRQMIGGLCYVLFFLAKGARFPKGKEWISVLILSFLNFTISNGLSTWALKYISAGLGAIMGAIFPLWLVVIGLFSSGGKMPGKAIVGLLIGFAGICVIFFDHLRDFLNPEFRFGILISLIATWSWAFGTLYTKKKAASFNPYFSLGLQMLISGIGLMAFTELNIPGVEPSVSYTNIPWQAWASIAYLVIFGSIISFMAYLYALQHLPTEQASVYAYINPIVAVLFGSLLFGEKLTIYMSVGVIIAQIGVFMVNRAFKALPAAEQPEAEGM